MVFIRQINCHKSIASTEQVSRFRDCDVVLLQEPNTSFLRSLNQNGKVFCAAGLRRRIRSAIFLKNQSLDLTVVPQFTTPDFVTVQIEGQSTMLCSAYLDINKNVWPDLLQDLTAHCARKLIKLVIGLDCNAHSPLWGCKDSNARGEHLDERIIQNNLFVHNVGSTPTFSSHLGESIIDITLSNSPPIVTGWNVSPDPSLSDHRIVEFHVHHIKPAPERLIRNFKKVNWPEMAADLSKAVPPSLPTWWSVHDLDTMCTNFTKSVQDSLDRQAPLERPGKRHSLWWTPECSKARAICLKLTRKADKARNSRANNSRILSEQASGQLL